MRGSVRARTSSGFADNDDLQITTGAARVCANDLILVARIEEVEIEITHPLSMSMSFRLPPDLAERHAVDREPEEGGRWARRRGLPCQAALIVTARVVG